MNGEPLVSDENGVVELGELESNRSYLLVETKAPDGYSMPKESIIINVDKFFGGDETRGPIMYGRPSGETKYGELVGDTYYIQVTNTAGARLPNTGGPGAGPYYGLGALLALLAAGLLIARRRGKG